MESTDRSTVPPDDLTDSITAARMAVGLSNTFYATLMCSATTWYDYSIPTLATDGKNYFINPDFARGLSPALLQSAIKHEIIHKAMLHVTRRGDREPTLWNIATDVVTNGIIVADKGKLGKTWVRDKSLEHLPAEEIYALMQDPSNKVGGKTGKEWQEEGSGAPQHFVKGPATPEEVKELEAEVLMQNATAMAQMGASGRDSNTCIMRHLKKVLEPKIDWKSRLRDFVTDKGDNDWTFAKPNKRYMAHGLYMPDTQGGAIGRLCVFMDTSGSIYAHKELLDQFCAEINSICEDLTPEAVDIVYVDSQVRQHDTFEQGEEFEVNIKGGGGTMFQSAFDYIAEFDTAPVAVIVFTDMYICDLDKCECDSPTLWMQYGNGSKVVREPPFGVVTPVMA